jgi:hypothetical protein
MFFSQAIKSVVNVTWSMSHGQCHQQLVFSDTIFVVNQETTYVIMSPSTKKQNARGHFQKKNQNQKDC